MSKTKIFFSNALQILLWGVVPIVIFVLLSPINFLLLKKYFSINETLLTIIFFIFFIFSITAYCLAFKKSNIEDNGNIKKSDLKLILKMFGITLLLKIVFGFLLKTSSENDELIKEIFESYPLKMTLLTVVFAPIVEEIIYRGFIGKAFSNFNISPIPYSIINGLIFGLFHQPRFGSIEELLYLILYSLMGFILAYAYTKTKKIQVSIAIHFLNNGLATLAFFLF